MLPQVVAALQPAPGRVFADGTLGGGGHTQALLDAGARVFGIDRDDDALAAAGARLAGFGDRFRAVKGNFKDMPSLVPGPLDGILLDLGVSSWQLDSPERGFSYMNDAPLDMRMDQSDSLSAFRVVNEYPEDRLRDILFRYGEEKFSPRIARAIVENRQAAPIATTGQLSQIITRAIPAAARRTGPHPAKRSFQAIRIEVNGELDGLSETVEALIGLLKPGGHLAVITFHSLEDRAVKQAMAHMENPCTCGPRAPICVCGKVPLGRRSPHKAIEPDDEELSANPRSRSAKLRVFERF